MWLKLQLLYLCALTGIFLARRKLQFYYWNFWNLDGWTKQSTPWNHISQNLTVNTVKCHFHDLLMTLVHCWSWLLPVFMLLLEDQLSEPEIMLMFKDKLKVSDLGYQLEGKEKGNMFSCKVGEQPLAVCVFPKQWGTRGAGEGLPAQGLCPMVFLFCLIAAFLSQQLKVLCHTLTASGFICPF